MRVVVLLLCVAVRVVVSVVMCSGVGSAVCSVCCVVVLLCGV